jgi:hypothetical protein
VNLGSSRNRNVGVRRMRASDEPRKAVSGGESSGTSCSELPRIEAHSFYLLIRDITGLQMLSVSVL